MVRSIARTGGSSGPAELVSPALARGFAFAMLGAALGASLLGGCARRTIEVTTEPPGALVWINDQEVGRTPLETDFKFFGTYDLRMALDGYEPVHIPAQVDSPWFEKPGVDLLIAPLAKTKTSARWHLVLTPSPEALDGGKPQAERDLLDRARAARSEMASETGPGAGQAGGGAGGVK